MHRYYRRDRATARVRPDSCLFFSMPESRSPSPRRCRFSNTPCCEIMRLESSISARLKTPKIDTAIVRLIETSRRQFCFLLFPGADHDLSHQLFRSPRDLRRRSRRAWSPGHDFLRPHQFTHKCFRSCVRSLPEQTAKCAGFMPRSLAVLCAFSLLDHLPAHGFFLTNFCSSWAANMPTCIANCF